MIHPRVQLVSADYIATMFGVSKEAVHDNNTGWKRAECDEALAYRWVFNVASDQNVKRELRFWSREVSDPRGTRSLQLEEVIRAMVPRRDVVPGQFCGLRNWEVGDLLRVSRAVLLELREELQARPHNGGIYVPRAALEDFFRRRWCFANCVRANGGRDAVTK